MNKIESLQDILSRLYIDLRAEDFAQDEGMEEQFNIHRWVQTIYRALEVSGYDMLGLIERTEARLNSLEAELDELEDDEDWEDEDFYSEFMYPPDDFDGDF